MFELGAGVLGAAIGSNSVCLRPGGVWMDWRSGSEFSDLQSGLCSIQGYTHTLSLGSSSWVSRAKLCRNGQRRRMWAVSLA